MESHGQYRVSSPRSNRELEEDREGRLEDREGDPQGEAGEEDACKASSGIHRRVTVTIILTPAHVLYLMSAIVVITTAVFNAAYYLGKYVGRLERVERDVKDLTKFYGEELGLRDRREHAGN
jgi:hypothetical protein